MPLTYHIHTHTQLTHQPRTIESKVSKCTVRVDFIPHRIKFARKWNANANTGNGEQIRAVSHAVEIANRSLTVGRPTTHTHKSFHSLSLFSPKLFRRSLLSLPSIYLSLVVSILFVSCVWSLCFCCCYCCWEGRCTVTHCLRITIFESKNENNNRSNKTMHQTEKVLSLGIRNSWYAQLFRFP